VPVAGKAPLACNGYEHSPSVGRINFAFYESFALKHSQNRRNTRLAYPKPRRKLTRKYVSVAKSYTNKDYRLPAEFFVKTVAVHISHQRRRAAYQRGCLRVSVHKWSSQKLLNGIKIYH
jgi:hypothetical protein